MSFHAGQGFPRGHGGPGIRDAVQTFRPQNLRPLPPQQPPTTQYNYGQPTVAPAAFTTPPNVTVMAPRPEFITYPPPVPLPQPPNVNYGAPRPEYMPFPPPVPPAPQNAPGPLPPRPPFPNQQIRPNFVHPPGFPPAPPSLPPPNNIPVPGAPAGQTPFPYIMPPAMPPPPILPQQVNYQPVYAPTYAQQPFPPPQPPPQNVNSYQQSSSLFPSNNNYWHVNPYQAEKFQGERRSPERNKHYDEPRHREFSHGEKHRSESHGERRDRGRSPDRRKQESSSRHRSEYDRGRSPPARGRTPPARGRTPPARGRTPPRARTPSHGRTPPRHRSSERSRERHRHRESRRSPFLERSYKKEYKRTKRQSQSPDQSSKRARLSSDGSPGRTNSTKDNDETAIKDKESVDDSVIIIDDEEKKVTVNEDNLKPAWVRCTDSENYYSSDPMDQVGESTVVGTSKLRDLYDRFEQEVGSRQEKAKATKPHWDPPKTKLDEEIVSGSDSDVESTISSTTDSEIIDVIAEIKLKKAHPDRLHEELWYNDAGQMNDGPLCKCSAKARRTGIRHSIYHGEQPIKPCRPMTNNAGRMYHYRITVSPATNFLTERPTVIDYDDHEYIFEGFSMFSHESLDNVPQCNVVRFNIAYTIHFIKEMMPENFCSKGLDLFSTFLFKDILELYDWNLMGPSFEDGSPTCPQFHFMPRFVRSLPGGGKEVLSMHQVLLYLLNNSRALVPEDELSLMLQWQPLDWQKYAEERKGMIVTNPGMKPSAIRIDQLDREQIDPDVVTFPIIVHFGIRPAQLSYAGDPQYQKLWKSYVKLRHLLANSPKVKRTDKQKLAQREEALQIIRQKNTMRREVTVELSSQGFFATGLRSDLCQHSMMLPVLTHHIRYHKSLMHLDTLIGYTFKDRSLLQLAMTHPSHHLNFGMNPDHARNSLSNCGIRQPKYGDRKVHYMHMRKRGINTLINIMARLGQVEPAPSKISHNERLELLGDAVVEFLTTVHLYYLFPNLEEGGLATYRTAIVQNQHLAMLAEKLELDHFMLYAHGPDLCRESDLRHAMANCFEALLGAVYLEGGLLEARKLFGRLLFNDQNLQEVWLHYPQHPLQLQEPLSDRQLIETSPVLQKLTEFEETIGVDFTHIRLLARAFTLRTVGFNHLTLGHNQRMEFLGDSIMQLVATEYLFVHFPDHHEGHLTLLRSSLVNNRTQAKVAEELGMQEFAITNDKTKRPVALRTKTLADLMESFVAALFIDKDLEFVHTFMNVCYFPRLKEFILNQDWNDPKSQLQQCCLTLRTEGKEPDIPVYKTLQTVGPSHCRTYTVAVYFKRHRIGCGKGPSIQLAEMGAAMDALEKYNFPQLAYQKRFIERKYKEELKEMRAEKENLEKDSEGEKNRSKRRRRDHKDKDKRHKKDSKDKSKKHKHDNEKDKRVEKDNKEKDSTGEKDKEKDNRSAKKHKEKEIRGEKGHEERETRDEKKNKEKDIRGKKNNKEKEVEGEKNKEKEMVGEKSNKEKEFESRKDKEIEIVYEKSSKEKEIGSNKEKEIGEEKDLEQDVDGIQK